MFSSRNKKAYQKIDDNYDDEIIRNSSCTSRLINEITSRSSLLRDEEEQQSLMAGTSSNHSYHDSPGPQPQDVIYEQFTAQDPPVISSSHVSSRRWDHIENLDEFFTHIYEYHQQGGFTCILLQKVFGLFQFIFIMAFTTFFTQCIDYNFLFANTNVTTHGKTNVGKRHFGDAIVENCASHLSIWMVLAILAAIVYWITRVIKNTNYILKMAEIQEFYIYELKITDDQLVNMTWHSIVKRICEVQKKLRLSIHTNNMTAINIYHRILRYKNYMIGMVNKRVLHPVFHVPFLGEIAYLPNNLKHEIERILFSSSTAPWDGPNLKDEYKCIEMLDLLTKKMKEDCKFYGIVSLMLMPLMLPFQIMESFFSLTELIKRRPDGLGMRRYSNYGRYLLRHFNELDHELSARLNRSHICAAEYMEQFFSPVIIIVAKNVTFIAAAIAGILAILAAWDEDVIQVEHVLTVMTICGAIIVACRGMIPDENLVWQPEVLMTRVASELHYLPSEWKGKAHTVQVRHEFDQLFQMKWMFYLLEITSPLFTPFVLLFWLKPRCHQFINFMHDYTIKVDGLGDVCTFALMDVGKHGDPTWNRIKDFNRIDEEEEVEEKLVTSHNQAMDGKTEMSVLHFKTTNPEWQPPKASEKFLRKFRNRLGQEASQLAPMCLTNMATLGRVPEVDGTHRNVLLNSVHSIIPTGPDARNAALGRHPLIGEGLHRIDGPIENTFNGINENQPGGRLVSSLYQEQLNAEESSANSLKASGIDIDGAGAEMRINSLFLRELHEESRIVQSRNYGGTSINPHAMASVFAMPEGFGLRDDSLINIRNEPTTTKEKYVAACELKDLNMGEAESETRSRLVLKNETETYKESHEQINKPENNEENDDDDEPPISFSN